eukprot:scaffold25450_cov82-Skeletonema_dohrnii-CCMP3373.AAC.4
MHYRTKGAKALTLGGHTERDRITVGHGSAAACPPTPSSTTPITLRQPRRNQHRKTLASSHVISRSISLFSFAAMDVSPSSIYEVAGRQSKALEDTYLFLSWNWTV